MDQIDHILNDISNMLWGWPMIIMLAGTHIFLTIRLRFPQRFIFKAINLSLKKDKDSEGDVSQFSALATALAATIGTGNIIGVGTAIALGGPGAVLWCWLTGIFGIATKYSEGLLAIKYRIQTKDGNMQGGPMCALEYGLSHKSKSAFGRRWWKLLAILFAVFTAIASFGIGASVQANAISTVTNEVLNAPTWIIGLVTAICSGAVIIGGLKSIAQVCKFFVPIMAAIYISCCIIIIFLNSDFILPAIQLIVLDSFKTESFAGGFAGSAIMLVARYGIARGLFSNESGLGSAPIIAAAAKTKNPVRQALVSSTGTFWDTVIICAMTGIVIVSTMLAHPKMNFESGGAMTKEAFSFIPGIGELMLVFCSITFAFSTILGWCYYGERVIEYLAEKRLFQKISTHKIIKAYRLLYILNIYVGAVVSLNSVWTVADIFNALMAIPNLLSLLFLSGVLVSETRQYLWNGNIDENME